MQQFGEERGGRTTREVGGSIEGLEEGGPGIWPPSPTGKGTVYASPRLGIGMPACTTDPDLCTAGVISTMRTKFLP